MTKIVQEKFQVKAPANNNDVESGWVSDASARTTKGTPSGNGAHFNRLPPGSNIRNQRVSDQDHPETVMAGSTDVSHDANTGSLTKGFTRRKMLGTDDEYTNEHTDLFYGEARVGEEVGFVERGNLLDRM